MKRRSVLFAAVVCLAAACVVTGSYTRAGSYVGTNRLIAGLQAQAPPIRQAAYLKASNPGMSDHFGEGGALPGHTGSAVAVSADGNTIAVGAPHESSSARGINGNENDDSAYNAGAAYVFTRSGGTWTRQAYIKASNAAGGDYFGSSVALSGDGNTLAVSAHWESSAATGVNGNQNDDSMPQAGAVYVFTRRGGTWTQQAYLKASNTGRRGSTEEDPGDGDQFGFSLAISTDGNTIAVGANSEDSNAAGAKSNPADDSFGSAGAVYVFGRTGTMWAQQAYLKADASTNTGLGDQFGFSLALNANGNTLAVGVYDDSGSGRTVNAPIDRGRGGSGAAYVFTRTGTTWTRQAYLKTWNADGGDSWGASVSLSGDGNTLAIGSLDEDCVCTGVHTAANVGVDDQKADLSTGAVAIFGRSGSTWTQQAYLKASNTGQEDWFGVRLAMSGDGNSLAVSAPNEDSAAQGINGRQNDESATEAGAVYFFTRSGSSWSQLAYIKGANTDAFDEFGGAVGLSGDGRTLVVGAKGEDSSARGVNGNQADNALDEAGAAYVFTR